jgi:hypothetical protein
MSIKIILFLTFTFGFNLYAFAQSEMDKKISICMMGAMTETSTEVIDCMKEIDPTLKILGRKNQKGEPLYQVIQRLCNFDFIEQKITSKEMLRCRKLGDNLPQ